MKIKLCSLIVDDQDRAERFYTEIIGFQKKHDIPVGDGLRWLTLIAPEGHDDVELALEPNINPVAKTYQEALLEQGIPATAFEVDDLEAEHARLRAAGVVFTRDPAKQGEVMTAVFADTCGNLIQLYQPPSG